MNRYRYNKESLKYYPGKVLISGQRKITLKKKRTNSSDGTISWIAEVDWPPGNMITRSVTELDKDYE